jgi:hypothetical protein
MRRPSHFIKRAPRVDVRRSAVLINSDGDAADVSILDISRGGFRLQTEESLKDGEFVTLCVERGEKLPAQIRWVLGAEAGGVFLTPAEHQNVR